MNRIMAYADAHPKMSAQDIGREMAAAATESELRAMAAAFVESVVDRTRRGRAAEAEHRATIAAQAADRVQADSARRAGETAAAERAHEKLLSDPQAYPGNRAQRRAFRVWAGDRFDEWYERGREAAEAKGDHALAFFESDWHDDGPAAYYRERRRRAMWELIDHESERVRLETTRELLATVFALGDGTEITWGAATVDQHRQRIELLAVNAAGVVETATRHRAAVRMIEESGVKCLDELAAVPAA